MGRGWRDKIRFTTEDTERTEKTSQKQEKTMMKRVVWAELHILDKRFRSKAFSGNRLSAPANFNPPLDLTWSIVVDFGAPSENGDFYWGTVQFLFENAPQESLSNGAELYLMDGPIPVIRITVSHCVDDDSPDSSSS
jgi:hypothetical protein